MRRAKSKRLIERSHYCRCALDGPSGARTIMTATALRRSRIAAGKAETTVKAGSVIGKCMPRHRPQEFRKLHDEVENNVPACLDIHVVMDNASSHKTSDPKLVRQAAALAHALHADIVVQVERFFALLAEKQIKRGAHTSVKDLIAAIKSFSAQQNADPKPLRCTKLADDILASSNASAVVLETQVKAG